MISGDINDFLDGISWGQQCWLQYKDGLHFIQGWSKEGEYHLVHEFYRIPKGCFCYEDDKLIYEKEKTCEWVNEDNDISVKEFLEANIWEGKKFYEVEPEIEWVD